MDTDTDTPTPDTPDTPDTPEPEPNQPDKDPRRSIGNSALLKSRNLRLLMGGISLFVVMAVLAQAVTGGFRIVTPQGNASNNTGNTDNNTGEGVALPSGIVWQADMETGNLSQWLLNGPQSSYDSGNCIRPTNGVSTQYAHSGLYSMKMTVDLPPESGCRQFRSVESKTTNTYYYSVWMLVPVFTRAQNYWNVFQFKSNHCNTEEPFYVMDLMSRSSSGPMYLRLRYKGGNEEVPGPHFDDLAGTHVYGQVFRDVTAGVWTHVEAYLRQSGGYTGQITIWQDGVQLYDLNNVVTKYPAGWAGCSTIGDQRWSVNNYSDNLAPEPASIYYDDAVVSTTRIGGPPGTPLPTSTPTATAPPAQPTATRTGVPTSTSTPVPTNAPIATQTSVASTSTPLPTPTNGPGSNGTATPTPGGTDLDITISPRACVEPCTIRIICPPGVTCIIGP